MNLFLIIFFIFFSCEAVSLEEQVIVIKDHSFIPSSLTLPAGQKIALIIDNQDADIEEFESFDLRREKIVPAKSQIKINIGPLEPGEYKFCGEFHSDTAQGTIIVK